MVRRHDRYQAGRGIQSGIPQQAVETGQLVIRRDSGPDDGSKAFAACSRRFGRLLFSAPETNELTPDAWSARLNPGSARRDRFVGSSARTPQRVVLRHLNQSLRTLRRGGAIGIQVQIDVNCTRNYFDMTPRNSRLMTFFLDAIRR